MLRSHSNLSPYGNHISEPNCAFALSETADYQFEGYDVSSEIPLPMFTMISRTPHFRQLEISLIWFLSQPYRLYDIE